MTKITNAIVTFIRDEEGTELVEWGLIAGLIIVVSAALFATIGADLTKIFTDLNTQTGIASGITG
jgi:pilus assembly protein Flp/PilA